jgi:hypothetical protein
MPSSTTVLRVIAVLLGLRALTNLGKPLGTGSGLVVLGRLVTGTPMMVLGVLVGAYMLILAWGLWWRRPWAFRMAVLFTAYVAVNIVRFPMIEGLPPRIPLALYAAYGVLAVGIPLVAAALLARDRARPG